MADLDQLQLSVKEIWVRKLSLKLIEFLIVDFEERTKEMKFFDLPAKKKVEINKYSLQLRIR